MDIQFWLYVIIGVIIFLSRVLKTKAPQAPETTEQPRPQPKREPRGPQTGNPKPLTFEELLREITEAKQTSQRVNQPERQRHVIDYDEEIGEEAQDLETIEPEYGRKERTYEEYEKAKQMAFQRPSLEETMKVSDTVVQYEKFKVFESGKQRNLLQEFTKDFSDPEGLKKAVVMSEILNRRFQY